LVAVCALLHAHAHDAIGAILQVANALCVGFQGISFSWLVSLVFLLGRTEDMAALYSFLITFEPKPEEISHGLFCCWRWQNDTTIQ